MFVHKTSVCAQNYIIYRLNPFQWPCMEQHVLKRYRFLLPTEKMMNGFPSHPIQHTERVKFTWFFFSTPNTTRNSYTRIAKKKSVEREKYHLQATKKMNVKKGVEAVDLKKRYSLCFLHSEGLARATQTKPKRTESVSVVKNFHWCSFWIVCEIWSAAANKHQFSNWI